MDGFIDVRGVRVPWIMYGTAWKEDRTAELTALALRSGFTAIDTANQRWHYVEADVGAAVADSGHARGDLFLQTKFTGQRGQDHRLPYDPAAGLATQVRQSFESSLDHLGTDYLDSYLLHGPAEAVGWSDADREVWRAMEEIHGQGGARLLGVSNVALDQLEVLWREAVVPPAFVQNRCFARTGWDREVRRFCGTHGIVYQGFSLLTANRRELARAAMAEMAERTRATIPQIVFRFAAAVGMLPLTGTKDPVHMLEDLAVPGLELAAEEVAVIERLDG